jgi:hypothetical protein
MFNENGTWKEFGYNRGSRHTIFPFWLFSVVWALVAYALASFLVASVFTGAAVAAMPSMPSYQSPSESEGDSAFESESDLEPPPQQVSKKPRAGYYVLNADTRKNGIRKYVYYGSEPPK